jgi:hypothetical protein
MENLTGAKRDLACKVLLDRYQSCVKRSIVSDVFASADVTAPTRKCAGVYLELSEHCKEHLPQAGGLGARK